MLIGAGPARRTLPALLEALKGCPGPRGKGLPRARGGTYSYSQCPVLSSQHRSSSLRNQSAISRRALSAESLP